MTSRPTSSDGRPGPSAPDGREAMLRGVEYLRRHARRLFLGLDAARTSPDERVRVTPDLLADAAEAGTESDRHSRRD